jgi:hypothetical protein
MVALIGARPGIMHFEPTEAEVEALAEAMISNPIYRITNRETAMAYFRANALTRLSAPNDPMARANAGAGNDIDERPKA